MIERLRISTHNIVRACVRVGEGEIDYNFLIPFTWTTWAVVDT